MQTNKISRNAVPGGRVVTAGGGAVAGAVVAAGSTPVLTTPGGNVVPGTGGTGGPVVTPGGTIGGPVVTPGGTIGGAVGLTPAKCKYMRQSSVPETIITIVHLRHLRTLYQNNGQRTKHLNPKLTTPAKKHMKLMTYDPT